MVWGRLAAIAAATGVMFGAGSALAAGGFRVGDKVRVWVSADYYDGAVKEVGTGEHAGQYLIHFDKFTTDQYALARNVLPRSAPAAKPKPKCRIMVLNGLPVCDPGSVKR